MTLRLPGTLQRLLGLEHRARARLIGQTVVHPTPKLHLGCGMHILEDWLNADLERQAGAIRLNATQRYPFDDGTFAYIFSEHMIEHIPYTGGLDMLQECYRTLRPGGVLRLVTPDLDQILGLRSKGSCQSNEYVAFFHSAFSRNSFPKTAVGAINAHFRLWGHQFLYDEVTLRESLEACGFRDVSRRALMSSTEEALQNLENENRYPPGLLAFESLVLEARKPIV